MRARPLLLIAVAASALLLPVFAFGIGVDDHRIAFKATATGGLIIDGKVKKIAVTESGGNVVFTVKADDIDTGIALRNKHMRGYLEADKFPEITLAIPRGEVTVPEEGKDSQGTVRGQFTAHGVTRTAVVTYTIKRKKKVTKVQAQFEYDIREHGIKVPSYLGITVEPVMPVTANVEVTE